MSAQDIVLTQDGQMIAPRRRTRSATISQRDSRRTRVSPLAAQGCSCNSTARLAGFPLASITRWCQRLQERQRYRLLDAPRKDLDSASTISVSQNITLFGIARPSRTGHALSRTIYSGPRKSWTQRPRQRLLQKQNIGLAKLAHPHPQMLCL